MKLVPGALVLALAVTFVGNAHGQCRLSGNPEFGFGALDRGRAILGNGYPNGFPLVRFYEKTAQGWVPQGEASVGDVTVFYPTAVALQGDRALAGAAESNALDGRAFVFDRVGAAWVPTEIFPASPGPGDFFGAAVALDGDVAVVGADHWALGGGDGHPKVHVFELGGGVWTETAQLAGYGGALDVEAGTIVLGNDDLFPGFVAVYQKVGARWVLTQRLSHGTSSQEPAFGTSLALEGDTLAVGAAQPSYIGPGRVEVFRRQGSSWHWAQTITPSVSFAGDAFGSSVALSGGTLLVGAPDTSGGPGRVHRFEDTGAAFAESGSFGPEGSIPSFGSAVAVQREDAILTGFPSVDFYRLGFAHTSSFCPTTPNSTGSTASLAVEGCDSVAGERMTLVADGLPPGALVHFLVGTNTTQVPFGDGFRCIGDPFFRVTGGASDASGSYASDLDFRTRPALDFTAGTTWHFQAVYRDPASSGARLNSSNALSVRITP